MRELAGVAAAVAAAWFSMRVASLFGRPSPTLLWALCILCVALGAACPLLFPPAQAFAAMALGWTLCLLSVIDIVTLRLPDVFTVPLCISGLGWFLATGGDLGLSLFGCAAGYGVFRALDAAYRRWRGRTGLGHGDAKLFAAAGAWLGLDALPSVTLAACALAFLWVGLRFARGGAEGASRPIPFGPPLCLAMWIVFVVRMPKPA